VTGIIVTVSSVVMCVEGVLRKHVTDAPIPVGIALYHGLANTFNVLLVSDLTRKELDRWCALEGLNRHAAIKVNEGKYEYFEPDYRRLNQVRDLRKDGYFVELVIEPDPSKSVSLLNDGFNVMTFTHSSFAVPQWRPDYEHKVKPWSEIESYETQMAELRAMEMLQEKKD
jgi:hypothetical protein